ncbi:MAG: hypothetical protein WDZ41_01695 [Candidatus Babeliales bacterium]
MHYIFDYIQNYAIYVGILGIRDFIEIIFFSWCIYIFSHWLVNDKSNTFIYYVYAFCILGSISILLPLPTIATFLFSYGPALVMLFMLMHQELLQRNYITKRSIKPIKDKEVANWTITLFQTLLHLNNNISLKIIIEKYDHIEPFIKMPCKFNAPFHQSVLSLVFEKPSANQNSFILMNYHGTLIAYDCTWKQHVYEHRLENTSLHEQWLFDTIKHTSKTDTIGISYSQENKTFQIIAQGKVIEELTAYNALNILQQYLQLASCKKKGSTIHEYFNKTNHFKQTQP